MPQFNRYFMAAGSLGVGLAIAFVMQSSAPASMADQQDQPAMATMTTVPAAQTSDETSKSAEPLQITELQSTSAIAPAEAVMPEALPEPPVVNVAADSGTAEQLPLDNPRAPAMECAVELTGTARAAAMVRLNLKADCAASSLVTIHHSGMMFTESLDDTGGLTIDVPALDPNAVFIAALGNGEGAVAVVPVPELTDFDRVAVQWQGPRGVELHAREFGADYGTARHRWHGAEGELTEAVTGKGGFLTRLGNGGLSDRLVVEVYTFPTGHSTQAGDVILSVESEVTNNNCGQSVKAQTIEVKPGSAPRVQDLTLEMPACDAVGEFLVLQTILDDLKIATK